MNPAINLNELINYYSIVTDSNKFPNLTGSLQSQQTLLNGLINIRDNLKSKIFKNVKADYLKLQKYFLNESHFNYLVECIEYYQDDLSRQYAEPVVESTVDELSVIHQPEAIAPAIPVEEIIELKSMVSALSTDIIKLSQNPAASASNLSKSIDGFNNSVSEVATSIALLTNKLESQNLNIKALTGISKDTSEAVGKALDERKDCLVLDDNKLTEHYEITNKQIKDNTRRLIVTMDEEIENISAAINKRTIIPLQDKIYYMFAFYGMAFIILMFVACFVSAKLVSNKFESDLAEVAKQSQAQAAARAAQAAIPKVRHRSDT